MSPSEQQTSNDRFKDQYKSPFGMFVLVSALVRHDTTHTDGFYGFLIPFWSFIFVTRLAFEFRYMTIEYRAPFLY